ncbi:MAG: hypothetical protein ACFE8U_12700 [Candidatus Hermodarchaeota archaeon]
MKNQKLHIVPTFLSLHYDSLIKALAHWTTFINENDHLVLEELGYVSNDVCTSLRINR